MRAGQGGSAVGRDEGAPGARAGGDPRRRDHGGAAGHERVLRAGPLGQAGGHEDHRGAPRGGRPDRHVQPQEGARQDAEARCQDQLLLLGQPLGQAPGLSGWRKRERNEGGGSPNVDMHVAAVAVKLIKDAAFTC
jgi:hypothetical protein